MQIYVCRNTSAKQRHVGIHTIQSLDEKALHETAAICMKLNNLLLIMCPLSSQAAQDAQVANAAAASSIGAVPWTLPLFF